MYCNQCGAALQPGARFCSGCGAMAGYQVGADGSLPPPPRPAPLPPGQAYYRKPAPDSGWSGLIPLRNGKALAAYYLGWGSFILPLLAVPALVYGVLGLRRYREDPEVKGAGHAVVGMVLAALAVALWLILVATWANFDNGFG
jgi:hypothetical protein